MTVEQIALVCHETNRGYCYALGDTSQVPWESAPDNIRQSAITGVQYRLDNPDATPEKQHEVWCEFKRKDGWIQGEVKDAERKTHPCLVPYDQLPEEQRTKDKLFCAVVDALK